MKNMVQFITVLFLIVSLKIVFNGRAISRSAGLIAVPQECMRMIPAGAIIAMYITVLLSCCIGPQWYRRHRYCSQLLLILFLLTALADRVYWDGRCIFS